MKRWSARHALARRSGATLRVLTAVKAGLAMYGETEAPTAGQARQGLRQGRGRAARAGGGGTAPRDRRARR